MIQSSLLLVLLIMIPLTRKYEEKLGKHKTKLTNYLFSNGSIRLFMEAYLELCLFSMLNINEIRWDLPFPAVEFSNLISVICFFSVLLVPFILLIYFYKHMD